MTITRILLFLVLICLGIDVLADVSCTAEDLSSIVPRPSIDFTTSVQPIINAYCSNCHNGRSLGQLDMDPGVAVSNLVNVPSSATTAGIPRVTPLDPDKSFLFKKINCANLSTAYGSHMPMAFEPGLPPPPPLSKQDQAAFRDWIVQGALAVATPPPSIALGGYLSGNWFDPSPNQSGQGFQLEFTGQADTVIAIWFVYPPEGGGQKWIYAQGTFDSTKNTVTMPAVLLDGPRFPPLYNSNDLRQTSWGTITFTFADCDHGTASWASTLEGYGSSSIPIQRLTSIQGTACPK